MPRIDGHGDLDMGFDWSMVKILCNVSATLPDFPTNVPQQVNEPNVQAGALSGTTNGHFTTNQTSPVFALNNHGIIPPSAWNSPRAQTSVPGLSMLNQNDRSTFGSYGSYSTLLPNPRVTIS
ncbi:hypothetical protein JHK87_009523 [Glycine soja]|nr:hypothetical protein JHK87_009523 [Glycine soja]